MKRIESSNFIDWIVQGGCSSWLPRAAGGRGGGEDLTFFDTGGHEYPYVLSSRFGTCERECV